MPSFTTRVELHRALETDYTKLHETMEAEGFSRTIHGTKGVTYHLPLAEYSIEGDFSLDIVLKRAQTAARATGRKHEILVTQSAGRRFVGLTPIKDEVPREDDIRGKRFVAITKTR